MPRPKQQRRMSAPPVMMGYKPFGIPARDLESLTLLFEEYETIRLLDYEGLTQEQASVKMNVSRPTLTRIYEQARRTMAAAFVEGKMIMIEGGNVDFGKPWFRCRRCYKLVEGNSEHKHAREGNTDAEEDLQPLNP
ncbi:MAG: DUF134 domain-containing protein [Bacteroidales bacterium]|nr:DUF134 domain-containing protein [Bacteroidales bacterium]